MRKLNETALSTIHKNIVICALPKSASTFIANVLNETIPSRRVNLSFAFNNVVSDHRLYFPNIIFWKLNGGHTISQHHMVAGYETARLVERYDLKLIVTTRNILDALISLRDDINRRIKNGSFNYRGLGFVTYLPEFFEKKFKEADLEAQNNMVIDYFAEWCFKFILSWKEFSDSKSHPVLTISYEKFIENNMAAFNLILKFLALEDYEPHICTAMEKIMADRQRSNFNKGETGRGLVSFHPYQIEKIKQIGSYFADTVTIKNLL